MKTSSIKIRGVIFASLSPATIDIHVGFGYGMIDGGSLRRVNFEIVPENCRIPNTYIWISLREGEVMKIEKMSLEDYLYHKEFNT